MKKRHLPLFALPCLFLLSTACAPLLVPTKDASRYYVIDSTPDTTPVPPADQRPNLALSIHRIQLPAYLDRTEIVRRTSPNRLDVTDTELWLEPLGQAATRVFSQSLATRLGVNRLALHPSLDVYRDALQIKVGVVRFDGNLGQTLTLHARWSVARLRDGQSLATGEDTVTIPLNKSDYETYVNGMGRALDQLAGIVADAIRRLPDPAN